MSLEDTTAIAKQLAFEINITYGATLMRQWIPGYGELSMGVAPATAVK